MFNVVDSGGWLEYFSAQRGDVFAAAIEAIETLIVPAISVFEVHKRTRLLFGDDLALSVAAQMRLGRIVDFDWGLAVEASNLSLAHKLPMANSIILATARRFDALLWTQDADFDGLDNVRYFARTG